MNRANAATITRARRGIVAALLMSSAAIAACATGIGGETTVALRPAQIVAEPELLEGARFISTGQPDRNVLQAARDAGVVAVIDLRGVDEDRGIDERDVAESLGLAYHALPVAGPDDVTYENAAVLDELLATIDGPVLLHCISGNRVGALFALRAREKGASPESALAIGRDAGLTRYESLVRERLQDR